MKRSLLIEAALAAVFMLIQFNSYASAHLIVFKSFKERHSMPGDKTDHEDQTNYIEDFFPQEAPEEIAQILPAEEHTVEPSELNY